MQAPGDGAPLSPGAGSGPGPRPLQTRAEPTPTFGAGPYPGQARAEPAPTSGPCPSPQQTRSEPAPTSGSGPYPGLKPAGYKIGHASGIKSALGLKFRRNGRYGLILGFSVIINSEEVSDKMLPSSASLGWEAGDKTGGTL